MITVHWCALYTKPHKERQVGGFLESKGYEVYVPGIRVRRRGRERLELLFSCYLFARLNGSGDVSSVRFTPGLRRIVSFGGEPAIVPDEVIALTRERLARVEQSNSPIHPFKPGDRVTIKSGPFADFAGVFEQGLSSRDRARILLDCLGRWTRCEVAIDSLRKVY
jgi:transcriptional antiterminator RfaH